MQPDALFQAVAATFAELGPADPDSIRRTLLLKDRQFVGHRFQCGDLTALWAPGASQVEFFDAAGQPLRTIPLANPPLKEAA